VEAVAAEAERAAMRVPAGWPGRAAAFLSAALSAYALYWVLFIVQPQVYRVSFLLIALILTFLLFPAFAKAPAGRPARGKSQTSRAAFARATAGKVADPPSPRLRRASQRAAGVPATDWLLIGLAAAALGWPLADFARFVYRAAEPSTVDLVLGVVTIGLVLEATRRAVGWILPVTAAVFLLYAQFGPVFDDIGLGIIAHRGYGIERLVGTLYMTLEGIFGVPLDVTATYIILFTIYGAVLETSGAGTFFINWALAASGRSDAAPGRSVTVAGFLLGTVSGSGVATTVMLGSVAWPILRRAKYSAETAGAMLSAAGIGALLSPPTLGAAAFLIAEFLQISYLQVLVMATIPTILYYFSVVLMIEADTRRSAAMSPGSEDPGATGGSPKNGAPGVLEPGVGSASPESVAPGSSDPGGIGTLTRRYWYHFTSLVAIAAFMVMGMSAFKAVFWASVLAVALSYVRRETALTPSRLLTVLRRGGEDVLGVAATTATAGIIVGVVTLTGLGLKLAGVIVTLAGGTLALTVIYSAIAVWMLGLAVPVTASYIIAAVMVAPALVQSGVPDFAAHMFIFYYAVLSEVSPPTALSPFAAAALTGGNPFKTMLLTWKYTLPAFVVPLVFTLRPEGAGILMRGPIENVVLATATAAAGIAALAGAFGGWLLGPVSRLSQALLVVSGASFLYGGPGGAAAGGALLVLVLILQSFRYGKDEKVGRVR
jgi:TRAP transporter 4TM/12TM fusion protein